MLGQDSWAFHEKHFTTSFQKTTQRKNGLPSVLSEEEENSLTAYRPFSRTQLPSLDKADLCFCLGPCSKAPI